MEGVTGLRGNRKPRSVVTVVLAERRTGEIVDTITATEDHPFYVDGKGFVPAGSLAIGNAIVTRAGPPAVVKEVRGHRDARGITVYNFVVDDNHNYFVGKAGGGVLVHNPDCLPAGLGRATGQLLRSGTTNVATREQAGELFYRLFGNRGFRNTTGFSELGTIQEFGGTDMTYHWDEALDAAGQLAGHGPNNPDRIFRHLQIHIDPQTILRIFFGPSLR